MMNSKILILLFSLFIFSSCTEDQPSVDEARIVYEKSLGDSFKDKLVKINNFNKTNGLASVENGIKAYSFEYDAELIYPDGLNAKCVDPTGKNKYMGWDCIISASQGVRPRSVGETVQYTGTIVFVKKEKGWAGNVVNNKEVSSKQITSDQAENGKFSKSAKLSETNLATEEHGFEVHDIKTKLDNFFNDFFLPDGNQFIVTPLGTLGGETSSANEISASGKVVVGSSDTADGNLHAFRWENGKMTDLGTLGGMRSNASAISADGKVVVGGSHIADGKFHAFRWENGKMTDLGTLGGVTSSANRISTDGKVVIGLSDTTDGKRHAFRWENGKMTDLGSLGNAIFNIITDSSADASVLVGISQYRNKTTAFRWENGKMTDLGTLGGIQSHAYGISADGKVVVGESITADGKFHAFRWENGKMTDLGTLGGVTSSANRISTDGKVVIGLSDTTDGKRHAFRWENGKMTDLGTLDSSATVVIADVSNNGQILVGDSFIQNRKEAFIATQFTVLGAPLDEARNIYYIILIFTSLILIVLITHKLYKLMQQRSQPALASHNQIIFCISCGNPQENGVVFCTNCGAKQES